jgi:hypothetical protein
MKSRLPTPMRRTFLTASPALLVAACNGTTTQTLTPAQVAADLQGALSSLSTVEGLIVAVSPNALGADKATIDTVLASAQSELATLSGTTPVGTGASIAQTIDGYLNTGVGILAKVSADVPGLSNFSPEINAVDAILPAVEAFVNQNLPASMTAPTAALASPLGATITKYAHRTHSTQFTLAQARARLRIPVMP